MKPLCTITQLLQSLTCDQFSLLYFYSLPPPLPTEIFYTNPNSISFYLYIENILYKKSREREMKQNIKSKYLLPQSFNSSNHGENIR